MFEKKLK